MWSPGKYSGFVLPSPLAMMPAGASIFIEFTASLCEILCSNRMPGAFGQQLISIPCVKLLDRWLAHTTLALSAPHLNPEAILCAVCLNQTGGKKYHISSSRL